MDVTINVAGSLLGMSFDDLDAYVEELFRDARAMTADEVEVSARRVRDHTRERGEIEAAKRRAAFRVVPAPGVTTE